MQHAALKAKLIQSLDRQRRIMAASIPLTPVDSIPLFYDERDAASFLHGFYISDKLKDNKQKRDSIIHFAGRDPATRDLNLIHRAFADALGAAEASLRLLSGLHAHIAVFMSLAGIGDSVLLLPELAGGHFATRGILQRLGLKVIDMAVDLQRLCVDRCATVDIVRRTTPDFIFIDRSEGLRYEDFSYFGDFRDTVKVFDASQYLPQILFGEYDSPFRWGFDLIVFTLHKSFPGPQKAGIASRESGAVWQALNKGLGELVSSSHAENTYQAAFVLTSKHELEVYTSQLVETALALDRHLRAAGVPVYDRRWQGQPQWPMTHHLWLPLHSKERAFRLYQALERVRLLTNYRFLPYKLGWGLRLGTTAATLRGLAVENTQELARIIADVYTNGASLAARHRVRNVARQIARKAMTSWPVRENEDG